MCKLEAVSLTIQRKYHNIVIYNKRSTNFHKALNSKVNKKFNKLSTSFLHRPTIGRKVQQVFFLSIFHQESKYHKFKTSILKSYYTYWPSSLKVAQGYLRLLKVTQDYSRLLKVTQNFLPISRSDTMIEIPLTLNSYNFTFNNTKMQNLGVN